MNEKIYYCIENETGKHNYVKEDGFTEFTCEFCFLPKHLANYKPMRKLENGKFQYVEVKSE